jgi:magnesium-transporting ATPase (P-type)
MTQEEYDQWADEYRIAKNDYERGDILAEQVQSKLETDMECLGVTGVEDKL